MTALSETKRIDIDVECAFPASPTSLLATAVDDDQINLSWVNSLTDTNIQVFRDGVLLTTIGSGSIAYQDTGLTGNTQYCYRLKYVNGPVFSNESCATTFNSFTFAITTSNSGDSNNDQFTLPLILTGTYSLLVRWGDGLENTITTWDDAATTHTYSSSGSYTVKVSGTIQGWSFEDSGNGDDAPKVTDVSQWGDVQPIGVNFFHGATNFNISATDNLDLSQTTTMDAYFFSCSSLTVTGDISGWDTSSIISFDDLFFGCTSFNSADITGWTTSSLTNLQQTFSGCTVFNRDISGWDVSGVTTFVGCFVNCAAFNTSIDGWTTTAALNMQSMFEGSAYNQTLNSWNVSGVTNMVEMFRDNTAFNGSIISWSTGAVTNFNSMFRGATAFNQNIGSWNVGNATDLAGMFFGASVFNQNITGWNTSSATTIASMFLSALAFDQDVSGWDTSSVISFIQTFSGATAFDQDLGSWDVTALQNAALMFSGVTLSTANYDALLVGWEAQAVLNNVTLDGGNSNYTSAGAGGTARAALIADHTWTITDGGGV